MVEDAGSARARRGTRMRTSCPRLTSSRARCHTTRSLPPIRSGKVEVWASSKRTGPQERPTTRRPSRGEHQGEGQASILPGQRAEGEGVEDCPRDTPQGQGEDRGVRRGRHRRAPTAGDRRGQQRASGTPRKEAPIEGGQPAAKAAQHGQEQDGRAQGHRRGQHGEAQGMHQCQQEDDVQRDDGDPDGGQAPDFVQRLVGAGQYLASRDAHHPGRVEDQGRRGEAGRRRSERSALEQVWIAGPASATDRPARGTVKRPSTAERAAEAPPAPPASSLGRVLGESGKQDARRVHQDQEIDGKVQEPEGIRQGRQAPFR